MVRILAIEKDLTNDKDLFPNGYCIIESGCGCCESSYDLDSVTKDDLTEFINYLEIQLSYARMLKRRKK